MTSGGKIFRFGSALLLAALLFGQTGCAVPQRPGKGLCVREVEPRTQTGYWLYLPEDYVANNGRHPENRLWPMVVTFHGLKPYDNANPQVREWEEEADRYGFIVIAPELRTCDSLTMQFPLRDPSLSYIQKDDEAIVAIMNEVLRRTSGDPRRVLATSFSSGGYIAHYIVNRHPDMFSCLAVRGSNFSESLLDPAQIAKYRDMTIGIFFGQNDFNACRQDSLRAVDWYRRHRFEVVAREVAGLGHQRRPQTAAALFAAQIGATPKTPPEIGQMVMRDVLGGDTSRSATYRRSHGSDVSGSSRAGNVAGADQDQTERQNKDIMFTPSTPPRSSTPDQGPVEVAPAPTTPRTESPIRTAPHRGATPPRSSRQPYSQTPTASDGQPTAPLTATRPADGEPITRERISPSPIPARLRVHGDTKGRVPMWVSLGVDMPTGLQDGASILWLDNDKPFSSNDFEAQGLLREPGEHVIEARIITADDRKIVLSETLTVLPAASQPADS